jgi:hypothetical protein
MKLSNKKEMLGVVRPILLVQSYRVSLSSDGHPLYEALSPDLINQHMLLYTNTCFHGHVEPQAGCRPHKQILPHEQKPS